VRTPLVVLGLLLCLPLAAQPGAPAADAPAVVVADPVAVPQPRQPEQAPVKTQVYRAQISEIAPDRSMLTVLKIDPREDPAKWDAIQLAVEDTALRSLLEEFATDDQVEITEEQGMLWKIAMLKVAIPLSQRLLALLGTAALLLLVSKLLTGRLSRLLVGEDNRYSKSKFQIAFWFLTAMSVYLATLWFRWQSGLPPLVGGVEIPENLLLLSGISALTFAGAKGIRQGETNTRQEAAAAGRAVEAPPPPAPAPRFPADLVNNNAGQPDLGDFQMVLITLIAGVVYASQVISFLEVLDLSAQVSIPDVDATLLGIFGISHGAYLVKKYVGGDSQDPPPQVNSAPPANP
jgi:hypothetical protein